jgi:glycosyltransferase involved in cell wall biosynthesis
MRLLCIHQNFPGQFRDLAPALIKRGHEIRAIACHQKPLAAEVYVGRYEIEKPERQGIDQLTNEVDEWIRRGRKVAEIAEQWRRQGWAPDAILAHPGWGETLFIREVYPSSPLLIWPELWLREEHMGYKRGEARVDLNQLCYLRIKNWLLEGALANCSKAIIPTRYQAECFPDRWQNKLQILHEGVRDDLLNKPRIDSLSIPNGKEIGIGKKVITYASRNLEPMRGFDRFLKAVALLQKQDQEVEVLIAGNSGSSYSGEPEKGKSWKEIACQAVEGELDLNRVHFLGYLDHESLIQLFLRSNLHVYLSNNFVLSWSVVEAMACGTPLLVDDNPMLRELDNKKMAVVFCKDRSSESLAVAMHVELKKDKKISKITPRHIELSWRHSNTVNQLEKLIADAIQGAY